VLLQAAVTMPLLSALALTITSWRRVLVHLIPWTAVPALMAAGFLPDGSATTLPWVLLQTQLGVDATGRMFLFFTALLWLLSGVFGTSYLAADQRRARFFFFYALAMSGNLGLILSQDMVGFFVFFALMSFASYGLVVHTGEPDARRAGRIYLYLVVIGEVLLFAAMTMLAVSSGSLELIHLKHATPTRMTLVLLLVSFGIKAGALPLHVWLPLAHPAAPTPASAVLSGAMIKAGLLGWLRFIPPEAGTPDSWAAACVVAGLAAAFYGVAVGSLQSNPKTILAYSSISQMGLITVGFGISLWVPASAALILPVIDLYAIHHGFAKGALFLGVGILAASETGTRASKMAWAGLVLAALSLAGAPVTSGAVAKTGLKTIVGLIPQAWQAALALLLPLTSLGTTVLMGRLIYVMADRPAAHARPKMAMWLAWLLMLGLVAATLFILPAAEPAKELSLELIWASLWPVAAGATLTALGWAAARRGFAFPFPVPPPGDIVGWYSEALRELARIAARIGAAAPNGVAAVRFLAGRCRQTIVFLQSFEPHFGDWQTSGVLFLLLLAVVFLYCLVVA